MLLKTKGVVLRFVKYKETSVIATVYTQEKGVISLIANSVRSKKSKGKIALFQPLSLVDIVIYHNPSKNLNRVSEINSYHPLHNLRQDQTKASISIFLTEILNKCLKEEEGNSAFYDFIQNSIIHLNEQNKEVNNFHLIFLIKFSLFLGIKPHSAEDFIHQLSNSTDYIDHESYQNLNFLLNANYDTSLPINNSFRKILLKDIIEYYRVHIDMGKINSIEILHELLHE
jgi:DNA repair protein RecO (recombination protein O)